MALGPLAGDADSTECTGNAAGAVDDTASPWETRKLLFPGMPGWKPSGRGQRIPTRNSTKHRAASGRRRAWNMARTTFG
jgi:hypothetical protein